VQISGRHILPVLSAVLALVIFVLPAGCGDGGEGETAAAVAGKGEENGEDGESGGNKSAAKGGNGSGGSGGGSRTARAGNAETRAEFFSNADAICRRGRAKTRSNPQFHTLDNVAGISKEKAKTVVGDGVVQYIEAEVSQLLALRPPADSKNASQAMLNAMGEMIVKGQVYPKNFILKREAISEAEAIARANGFKVCGSI
jgi:hypothetical protein